MNKKDANQIKKVINGRKKKVVLNDLKDKKERTLLYGQVDGLKVMHTYIKGKRIYTVKYDNNFGLGFLYAEDVKVEKLLDYVLVDNNFKVVIELSDYEFCNILAKEGVPINFESKEKLQTKPIIKYSGDY